MILRVDGFSDREDNPLHVPNELFFSEERTVDLNAAYGTRGRRHKVRGLIHILSSYKFTIAENTPIEEEIALDPELLGKVFENLLAAYNPETEATARKQTGSFYTPREIVNYMTDESLVAYLKNELITHSEAQRTFSVTTPPSQLDFTKQADPVQTELDVETVSLSDEQKAEIEQKLRELLAYNDKPHRFDEAETKVLIKSIDTLKILDPAVGSGAFPMGVLHRLVFILGKLDPRNEQWRQRQIVRVKNTIKRAEEIDDSTIRESTIRDLEQEIESINEAFERNELDYGRKLYLIENCIYGVDKEPIAVQIAKLRFFISLIVDQQIDDLQENRGVRPLPNLETKFVAANTLIGVDKPLQMQIRNPQIDRKEKELEDVRRRHFTARTRGTKTKYRELDAQIRAEISELLESAGFPHETTEKIAHWDPYDQNISADFFDSEWMFNIKDGFDVVIGNPPYVRQEKIKELKPTLKNQYDCYTGVADLYVYFYERGFQLLRDNGILTYISSNKYFRATYGKKLRDFLACQSTVSQLIDFGAGRVFAASVNTSIITTSKTPPEGNHLRALNWELGPPIGEFGTVFRTRGFTMPQNALTADGWRLASPAVLNLLEKLRNGSEPLGEYVKGRFYMGIKTGLNEAFVVNKETRDKLIAEHPSSNEVLKPFLRGRDVRRWQLNYQDLWLIFIRRGADIDNYPAIKRHLSQYRKQLEPGPKDWPVNKPWPGRKAGPYKWYEIQDNIAYWQEFEQSKIIYPDIYQHQSFTIDTAGFYCGNTCYFIPTEETWLCGLLNARSVAWFYSLVSNRLGGGALRGFSDYIKQIPIPNATTTQKISISQLVDQILAAKRTNPDADVFELENEIDQIVYSLYDLTLEEIAIVKEAANV